MEDLWMNLQDTIGGYVPTLLAALAVLLVGWLIALIIASLVKRLLHKTELDNKLVGWIGQGEESAANAEKWIGRVVFWLLMVFVLLGFFQVLGLAAVSGPLASFQDEIFSFLPAVISAVILLLVAWVIATVVRIAVRKGLEAARLDERLDESTDLSSERRSSASDEDDRSLQPRGTGSDGSTSEVAGSGTPSLVKTLSETAYWLVFLLFLPAVLDAIGLDGLLEPVNELMGRFLGFLPNVLAAALIVLLGWLVARIVRRVVTNLLAAAGIDRLSESAEIFGRQRLSKVLGIVVYVLIMIPVLIAGLNALQLNAVTEPASDMLGTFLDALPRLFAAAVLLVFAWIGAKLVSGLVSQLLGAIGFDRLFARLGFGEVQSEENRQPSQIMGTIVMIAVMLFAGIEALELLEFDRLATLLASLTVFLGKVALGVLVFGAGLYLSDLAARTIRSSGLSQASLLATSARVAILILSGAMALRQMDVAEDIINMAFGLTLGAAAVAAAIAFGLGGRDFAQRRLEELESRRLGGSSGGGSAGSSTPPGPRV